MFALVVLLELIICKGLAYYFAFVVNEAVALCFILHHDTVGRNRGTYHAGKMLEWDNCIASAVDATPIVVAIFGGIESALAQVEVEVLCRYDNLSALVY